MFLPDASTLMHFRLPCNSECCLTRPESSRAVPGRWTGCRRAGAATTYEPSAGEDRRGRPRDRRAARTAARPRTTGSPAGCTSFTVGEDGLHLELEEMRWALRLIGRRLRRAVACCASCATTRAAGSPAAAPQWVASWAGVWALGAGGAVDAGEDPALALGRELQEEWSVEPERLAGRGAAGDARRHDDADRPGLARARRRGHARPRARRPCMVACGPGRLARGSTSATPANGDVASYEAAA